MSDDRKNNSSSSNQSLLDRVKFEGYRTGDAIISSSSISICLNLRHYEGSPQRRLSPTKQPRRRSSSRRQGHLKATRLVPLCKMKNAIKNNKKEADNVNNDIVTITTSSIITITATTTIITTTALTMTS